VTNAFTAWLKLQRDASKVVINSDWTNYTPTTPTLPAQNDFNTTSTAYVATFQAKNGQK